MRSRVCLGLLVLALGLTSAGPTATAADLSTKDVLTASWSGRDVDNAAAPDTRATTSGQRSTTPRAMIRRLEVRASRITPKVAQLVRTGHAVERWFDCIDRVPIDRRGDPQGRWGLSYDERDGTGLDLRTALALHQRTSARPPRWTMLDLSRRPGCLSRVPDPNGTGADARTPRPRVTRSRARAVSAGSHPTLLERARRLQRTSDRLARRLDRAEDIFGRFDNWESCLVWLPVTEAGDLGQQFGYEFVGPNKSSYRPAIDIDSSEWDDPDYEILAFLGRAHPFAGIRCGPGPGEGVDKSSGSPGVPSDVTTSGRSARMSRGVTRAPRAVHDPVHRLRQLLAEVRETLGEIPDDLEDMVKEAEDFRQFDECMFTIGVTDYGSAHASTGYRFTAAGGRGHRRVPALAFDLRGSGPPQFDMLAFPGEEPPQIECNEDAGGQETDE